MIIVVKADGTVKQKETYFMKIMKRGLKIVGFVILGIVSVTVLITQRFNRIRLWKKGMQGVGAMMYQTR